MEITSPLQQQPPPPDTTTTTTAATTTTTTIPITRSDPNNPYPTTFVTADTSSFKQVVQMLTGSTSSSSSDAAAASISRPVSKNPSSIPPIKTAQTKPNQSHKLYERRSSFLRTNLMNITPTHNNNHHHNNNSGSGFVSPRKLSTPEILSPSLLNFPGLTLSPVTPLTNVDQFEKGRLEEERAIAEKGFYLHPSPRESSHGGGGAEGTVPELLPLFPVRSPRENENEGR